MSFISLTEEWRVRRRARGPSSLGRGGVQTSHFREAAWLWHTIFILLRADHICALWWARAMYHHERGIGQEFSARVIETAGGSNRLV